VLPEKDLSAHQMLELWGHRMGGKRLQSVGAKYIQSGGGAEGIDHDARIVRYVEETKGFAKAKPVLVHVYARCKPLEAFSIETPGHGYLNCLYEHGWGMFFRSPRKEVPRAVLLEFIVALELRIKIDPYRVPLEITQASPIPPNIEEPIAS
jgi:hypothetical protein